MHVTLVHIHVNPEHIERFISATRVNHECSIQESGNHRFDVLQDPDDATHFILYEAFASVEDADAHKQTMHYAQWRETVAEMMSLPRQGQRMNALFPTF